MADKRHVSSTGRKYDTLKPNFDLQMEEVNTLLAMLFTNGACKYDPRDIENGLDYGRLYAAARRHMIAWFASDRAPIMENLDKETGAPHLIAAIWNLYILCFYELHQDRYSLFDDRPEGHDLKLTEEIVEIMSDMGNELKKKYHGENAYIKVDADKFEEKLVGAKGLGVARSCLDQIRTIEPS